MASIPFEYHNKPHLDILGDTSTYSSYTSGEWRHCYKSIDKTSYLQNQHDKPFRVLRKYGSGESDAVAYQIRSQPGAKHPLPISPQLLKLFI